MARSNCSQRSQRAGCRQPRVRQCAADLINSRRLWLVGSDGAQPHELTSSAGWTDESPLWSFDGYVEFVQAEAAPVFVGFGSMAPTQSERLSDVVATAVKRAGVRAVVQSGWAAHA